MNTTTLTRNQLIEENRRAYIGMQDYRQGRGSEDLDSAIKRQHDSIHACLQVGLPAVLTGQGLMFVVKELFGPTHQAHVVTIATDDIWVTPTQWHDNVNSGEAIYYERWDLQTSAILAHGWVDSRSRKLTQSG